MLTLVQLLTVFIPVLNRYKRILNLLPPSVSLPVSPLTHQTIWGTWRWRINTPMLQNIRVLMLLKAKCTLTKMSDTIMSRLSQVFSPDSWKKRKEYLVLQKCNKHVHIFIHCIAYFWETLYATTWISVSESSLKNLGSMSGSGSRECGCCSTNQRWALLPRPIRAHLVQVHGLTPPQLAQPPPPLLGTRLEIRAVNEHSRSFHNARCKPLLGPYSLLKAPTIAFTLKNLLRHFAIRAFKYGK